ncbi:hypothetical protein FRC04_011334 [Tulasnella sp. 424]|nr:hypothetical protein FRC04_011334 [Tulasnella sp. 424]
MSPAQRLMFYIMAQLAYSRPATDDLYQLGEFLHTKLILLSQLLDHRSFMHLWTMFLLRKPEPEELHIAAIKRIISTSDDVTTLLHAIANIFAIRDRGLLGQLITEGELRSRLLTLSGAIYRGTMRLGGADCGKIAVAGARLVDSALAHIILSIPDDVEANVAFHWLCCSVFLTRRNRSSFSLETHLVPSSSPVLLEAHIAYMMTLRGLGFMSNDGLNATLLSYSEHLASPSWRMMSLMAIAIAGIREVPYHPYNIVIMLLLDRHAGWRKKIRAAYLGGIRNALFNIERASADRAVFDKEQNPPVEVEQVSVILQLTEHYILDLGRTRTISEARWQLLIDMLKVFQETGLRLVAGERFPIGLADRLISLFAGLEASSLKIPRNENEVEVLQSFGPLVHGLLALQPSRNQALRQAYDAFKLNVDRASYTIKV